MSKLKNVMVAAGLFALASAPTFAVELNQISDRPGHSYGTDLGVQSPVQDKLLISGDVGTVYKSRVLTDSGTPLVGSGYQLANQFFFVEANLRLNYKTENAWMSTGLEFRNMMGNMSGASDGINLERALIGYNILQDATSRLDIEVGRTRLDDVFDSKIQFNSRMDGILLGYANVFEGVGDLVLHGAIFLYDDVTDHYSWVAEGALHNIMDTGTYFKYSFIDWSKAGATRFANDQNTGFRSVRNEFKNSQFTLGYKFNPEFLNLPAHVYGAFLINTAGKVRDGTESLSTNGKKANKAWYAGLSVGEVKKMGDWSVGANYQSVEAQAIPDRDINGIGLGDVRSADFFATTPATPAIADTNYKGFSLVGQMAFSDHLILGIAYLNANEKDQTIRASGTDGRRSYHNFQAEARFKF
ncbi:hypothetical protein JYU14_03270 [Simkania negevensis]|uniref:Major outer membrane protein n=1 Tax=Simkania negevensis TaxID=83561 RepID=A0ABS3ARD2_9BACT|nr:hypothetical protein [Simkania negevensis]